MVADMFIPADQAGSIADQVLPRLKRWTD
jgi:hypothetical protein